MPAVMIRQLDGLTQIMALTSTAERRTVLMEQADMILRSSEESVPDPSDQADVRNAYDALLEVARPPGGRIGDDAKKAPGLRPQRS